MRKVIIDTDPGIDDAMAILLALKSPELKVEAITTVSGNVHVDLGTENALRILEIAEAGHIPVAKGMTSPLTRKLETAEHIHGTGGLGDAVLPPPKLRPHKLHAIDMIIEKVKASPGEITLVPIGPLTNVATAFLMEPGIIKQIKEIILMGGAFAVTSYGCGNASAVAEFNIYVDPEAAKIVFNSGLPITAVGLDVTMDPGACLREEHMERLCSANTPASNLIVQMIAKRIRKQEVRALHDPLAIATTIDKGFVITKKYYVDVETSGEITRGQTVTDRRIHRLGQVSKPNVDVCCGVHGEKFVEFFIRRIT